MNLQGKKVAFLGDSITAGACASKRENVFHQIIAVDLKLQCAKNYGVSGTRIARQTIPSKQAEFDEDFNVRAEKVLQDGDVDTVFVFGGTNDFGHGDAPLGTIEDASLYTFYGATKTLLEKLSEKFGKENVVVLTPMHRKDDTNPKGEGYKEQDGEILSVYVQAIKEVAKLYGIKTVDLFNMDELNPNISGNEKYFMPDGLHPNDDGHKLLAQCIEQEIGKL